MAPTLSGFLAFGALISSTVLALPYELDSRFHRHDPFQRPGAISVERLQASQPTLSGLPSNSNVTLFLATLGIGHQNYTCNGTEFVQTATGSGALADLYDITDFLREHPSEISVVAQSCQNDDCGSLEQRLTENRVGLHYFSEDSVPTFNLSLAEGAPVLSAAKIDSVSVSSSSVPWLFLLDADDGISQGGVNTVYRVDTNGGVQSPLTCSSEDVGKPPVTIPYAAQYWFYK